MNDYKFILICLIGAWLGFAPAGFAKCNNVAPPDGTSFNATVGVYFSRSWSGNGNCSPWTSSYPAGYLGLTFSNGTLSGTPTGTVVNYSFTVTENNGVVYSYTLTISAGACSFVSGSNGAISFGNLDPTTSAAVAGTVTTPVQFTCSSGLAYSVTVNPSSGWQVSSGSNTIGYSLGAAPGGTSTGAAVDLFTAGSTIAPGQYVNAPAGNYANTSAVTATVSWTGGSITASLPVGGVTATVISECAVAGSPSVSFGVLDAVANAGGAAATVTPPSIRCTMDSSVSIADNGGLNFSGTPRLKDASGNYIPYNINYASSLTGSGGLTDVGGSGAGRLSLSASMPANALDNAPAGTYSDTVTLTISY